MDFHGFLSVELLPWTFLFPANSSFPNSPEPWFVPFQWVSSSLPVCHISISFLESTSKQKAASLMALTSHVFILWRVIILYGLCFIFIVVYVGRIILIWIILSWWEVEVALDQILLCILVLVYSALLWEWKHPEGSVYVFPPEYGIQPICFHYVGYLILVNI